jgi:hypothetical protein
VGKLKRRAFSQRFSARFSSPNARRTPKIRNASGCADACTRKHDNGLLLPLDLAPSLAFLQNSGDIRCRSSHPLRRMPLLLKVDRSLQQMHVSEARGIDAAMRPCARDA